MTTPSPETTPLISPEAELVLCLCRPNPTPAQTRRAEELLRADLDWGRVTEHAARHRVLPAVFSNVTALGGRMGEVFRQLARATMLYNGARFDAFRREFTRLRAAFEDRALAALPRKGIYLASAVYPDPAWRAMGDIDFLVRRRDSDALRAVMHDLGYQQGSVSADYRRVTPISREVEAFWLLHAGSMPSFVRPVNDSVLDVFAVDLRYSILEPAMNKKFDMESIFAGSRRAWFQGRQTTLCSRADFFLDVCVHLYREAVTLTAIEHQKDIRLYKYVDVAELLASPSEAPDPTELARLCSAADLRKEMFFVLSQTAQLLADSVPANLLDALDPGSHGYLDEYGTVDGKPGTWQDPLPVRAFDYGRRAQVTGRSTLIRS
jgi:hypothetical protein